MTETIQTKTGTVVSHEPKQHHWLLHLDDKSVVAVSKLLDPPPVGTEVILTLEPYKLSVEMDPHQDERMRVIRVQWDGTANVHCAEFDALISEHEVLRANLVHVRGLLDGRPAAGSLPQHPSAVGVLVRRLGDAWAAFRGDTPAPQAPEKASGPFPGGTPPWASQIPGPTSDGGERR